MNKNPMKVLLFSLLIGITVYIERPILPSLLELYCIDAKCSGYLFASLSFAVMIFAPFWGDVGDIKGRKLVLISSLIGMSISQFIFGLADSIIVMVISRFLFGTFLSGIAVSFMAFFNDNYDNGKRTKMISYNLAVITLGLALGSLIGGYLGNEIVFYKIYFLQSFLFLVLGIVIYFLYPKETLHIDIKRNYIFNLWSNIKRVKGTKLLPGMIITMVFAIGIQVTLNFLEFYLTYENFTPVQIGSYIFTLSIVGVIGNFIFTPNLLRILDETIYLIIVLLVSGVSLLVTYYNPIIGIYGFMFGFGLTHNMFKPITTQVISKKAGDMQGVALGVRETLIHLGMVIGSLIGGFLISGEAVNIFLFSSFIMFIAALGFASLKVLEICKKKIYSL